jgi:5-methylcytosine-specific restriction endonuclease McrA
MNCLICDTKLSGKQTRACSKTCKIRDDGNQRRESGKLLKSNMTAEQYARKLQANALDRKRNPRRYYISTTCCWCGKQFESVHKAKSCGSKGCVAAARQDLNPSTSKAMVLIAKPARSIEAPLTIVKGSWFTAGTCDICATSYVSRHTDSTCSPRCHAKKKRQGSGRQWITPPKRHAIYRRDNWTCQICYGAVDQDLEYSHENYQPEFPSLDHIVPRSVGGTHEPHNLRLAHVGCNSERGIGEYAELTELQVA